MENETYTVKFNANGGTGEMSDVVCELNGAFQIPTNQFKRTGYVFVGWRCFLLDENKWVYHNPSDNATFSGNFYMPGDEPDDWTYKIYDNQTRINGGMTSTSNQTIVFYAKWKEDDTAANVKLMDDYFYGQNGCEKDDYKAFEYGMKAAKAGDAYAQHQIGFMYNMGISVIPDLTQAHFWYHKAAEQNNTTSFLCLGNCYSGGEGVAKDLEKAFEFYKKAADLGNYQAKYKTAKCYLWGNGTARNYEKAEEYGKPAVKYWADQVATGNDIGEYDWYYLGSNYDLGQWIENDFNKARECYEKSAAKGNHLGQKELGEYYEHGKGGLKVDYAKALELYTLSSQQGNSSAYFNLGELYYYGRGVEEEKKRAVEYYQEAAKRKHYNAEKKLAGIFLDGDGVPFDAEKAWAIYKPHIENGSPPHLYDWALFLLDERGIEQDVSKALDYLKQAAEKEHIQSLTKLGSIYCNGSFGVAKDYKKGFENYDRATKWGNTEGLGWLGYICYNGFGGVEKNSATAVGYWERSNSSASLYNIGMAYKHGGYGIEKDLPKAVSYFQKSASAGHAGATCKLASFHCEGIHFEKDVAKAVELYKKAAGAGSEEAKKWLDESATSGI